MKIQFFLRYVRGGGGSKIHKFVTVRYRGGREGGVENPKNLRYVICERSLIWNKFSTYFSHIFEEISIITEKLNKFVTVWKNEFFRFFSICNNSNNL